jgi:hypothetical protein
VDAHHYHVNDLFDGVEVREFAHGTTKWISHFVAEVWKALVSFNIRVVSVVLVMTDETNTHTSARAPTCSCHRHSCETSWRPAQTQETLSLEIIGNAASLPIKLVICVFDEGIRLTASHTVDVDKEAWNEGRASSSIEWRCFQPVRSQEAIHDVVNRKYSMGCHNDCLLH